MPRSYALSTSNDVALIHVVEAESNARRNSFPLLVSCVCIFDLGKGRSK